MPPIWRPDYLFAACQVGAEAALKDDLLRRLPGAHPAFSRPGFVTLKLAKPCEHPDRFQWWSPLARTGGFALTHVDGDDSAQLASRTWSAPELVEFLAACPIADLHVWQRDFQAPGDSGFEPGPNEFTKAACAALLTAAPSHISLDSLRPDARGRWAIDIVLIEEKQWWIGCHRKTSRVACWPGGVPPIELPEYAVSRAYLKMAEAIAWSSLPMAKGDRVAELGCAPGGASQALLDAGLWVVGIDPAEVDPALKVHSRFTHVRRRTKQLSKTALADVKWLCADMNVAPQYTLDAVEELVKSKAPGVRGMLLTLKLPKWELLDDLPALIARIQSWGYRDVRVRQLAFNRQEICLAVLKTRSHRRVIRAGGQRRRVDQPHTPRGPRLGGRS